MSDVVSEFSISMEQIADFEFRVKFDGLHHPHLLMDEPPPLGHDAGPAAARVLAAAIGNCLSASFLFCSRRAGLVVGKIHTDVRVQIVRNEARRLRIGKVYVVVDPSLDEAEAEKSARCAAIFEDYCTVTQSIRKGIPVNVTVKGLSPQ